MEDDPVIVQILIDHGASMTVKSVSSGKKANTPLFLSAATGKKQAAEVLLKNGGNPDDLLTAADPPIHLVELLWIKNRLELFRMLLQYDADINHATGMYSAITGQYESKRTLLDKLQQFKHTQLITASEYEQFLEAMKAHASLTPSVVGTELVLSVKGIFGYGPETPKFTFTLEGGSNLAKWEEIGQVLLTEGLGEKRIPLTPDSRHQYYRLRVE
ncbi:MAG: hypothetical protein ACI8QI_000936 [Limisphaerales bacterium]|jgi:hypothetical protein